MASYHDWVTARHSSPSAATRIHRRYVMTTHGGEGGEGGIDDDMIAVG